MTREERKNYQGLVVAMAIMIVAIFAAIMDECDGVNIDAYAAPMMSTEEIIAGNAGGPENGQIRNSAMPCEAPEMFAEWYATYEEETHEPETDKEARTDTVREDYEDVRTEEAGSLPEATAAEVESSVPPLYRISGETIDESIQIRLYQYLQAAGIPWWYEGALCQMFQESHGQVYAENPNGLDKGLYQFRTTYWDWSTGDIFDVDAQLSRYASEMAARFNAGLSTDEVISRHKTSDYCTAVDWLYVQHVRQWLTQMEVVK